jgi:hypothetical protein
MDNKRKEMDNFPCMDKSTGSLLWRPSSRSSSSLVSIGLIKIIKEGFKKNKTFFYLDLNYTMLTLRASTKGKSISVLAVLLK